MPRKSGFVYHGTNEKHLKAIRRDGLHPSALSGVSNYSAVPGPYASHEHYLYLSNTRALIYGLAANGRRRVLLLEIPIAALDEVHCYPDEDNVVTRQLMDEGLYESVGHKKRFEGLVAATKPADHREQWRSYFEQFGNIAYAGSIPFSAVTRYVLIDEPTLKTIVFPVLHRFQPPITALHTLLDYEAESIAFMFDGTDIAGVPSDEMRKLRVYRLAHVDVRAPPRLVPARKTGPLRAEPTGEGESTR